MAFFHFAVSNPVQRLFLGVEADRRTAVISADGRINGADFDDGARPAPSCRTERPSPPRSLCGLSIGRMTSLFLISQPFDIFAQRFAGDGDTVAVQRARLS